MTTTETSDNRTKINASKSLNISNLIESFEQNNFINENEIQNKVPIIFFYKTQSYRHPSSTLHDKKSQENQKQKQLFVPTKQNIYLETNKVCMKFYFNFIQKIKTEVFFTILTY